MNQKAFQDYYPDELSHCYGCGRFNEHGLQLKSYWDGEKTVARALALKPVNGRGPGRREAG